MRKMKHSDNNLKYDEAVVSFAASALDMSRVDYDYGVINFAEATMDGIKRLIDRFVSEHSSAKDYIAKYGKDEFGAYFLCDVGGFGDGLEDKALSDAAYKFAHDLRIYEQLDVVEGDDGWLHIEALEAPL